MLVAAATMGISIAIISSISRPLTIVVDTIAIRSMVVRTALVDIRAGTAIVSWLSGPLAIITTISVTSIVSVDTLGASVCVAYSMAVTISRLSISGPLAISMSNVVSIGVLGWVVSISMVSLGDIDRSSTISMTISRFSLSRSLTISMISISTIVTMKTLRTPVCVA